MLPNFMKPLQNLSTNIKNVNVCCLKLNNFCFIVFTLLLTSCSSFSQENNMKVIKVGSKIPTFKLSDQNGILFDMDSVIGKKNLVIFFYPKDDTPGCTAQACSFRDQLEVFNDADALIIGISGQSVESHKKFAEKYRLSYTLLSDEGNKIRTQFGVPTNMMGLIPGRVTYIADKTGTVIYVFNSQTKVTAHVDEALKALKQAK